MIRVVLTAGSLLATTLIVVGAVVLFQPEWLVSSLRGYSPQVLYAVETDRPVVALTIDDGPDPYDTPRILEVLNEHDARATFFLITSRIPGNEDLVERMLAEGHELGNHLTSEVPSISLPLEEFERQLLEADRALSEFTETRWMRPGSGWYNDSMLEVVNEHGYRTALGSIYPYDPQHGSAWFSAQYVLWKAKPGAVIVLHDHNARGARTAEALATILPELLRRGYRVVTLSELVSLEENSS